MAKAPTVERTRRAYVPDPAWLAKQAQEPILEPDLPIVDPHHHLWDHPTTATCSTSCWPTPGRGHNITATVFIDCRSMYRGDGPAEMQPVGETEFANGVAAMSASGIYGPTRACAGIVGHVDLTPGRARRARCWRPMSPPATAASAASATPAAGTPAPTCATATPTRRRGSTARPPTARAWRSSARAA